MELTTTITTTIIMIAPVIIAIMASVTFYYVRKQHKIHYDSELTGFIKESESKQGLYKLECFLVNSGGVPIIVDKIFYILKDANNSIIRKDKVDNLENNKIPIIIEGQKMAIIIIPFAQWTCNKKIIMAFVNNLDKINKIELILEYVVYNKRKKISLSFKFKI